MKKLYRSSNNRVTFVPRMKDDELLVGFEIEPDPTGYFALPPSVEVEELLDILSEIKRDRT